MMMMEEHQDSMDVSSERCLGSRYPQENHISPQQYQGRDVANVKVEPANEDEVGLRKSKEERTPVDVTLDEPSKKYLGSGGPQKNHEIPQEHQSRNMTTIKAECEDEDEMDLCHYKEVVTPVEAISDASGTIETPEQRLCSKKTQRMRKPIKSEILRFGKMERRLEVKEEDHCTGDELVCNEEKQLLHISTDGHSKRVAPERCLQNSIEDHCYVPKDDEALNLTSYEQNILQSKVKESALHTDESSSRSRPDSDCSEDYSTIQDCQEDCLEAEDEAVSHSDSEDEMYRMNEQRVKEEGANESEYNIGYEVSYDCTENMYRAATTSGAAALITDCERIPVSYDPKAVESKQFICTECGKSFSLYSYLTKHQRSHSGEKPFSCNECGKCFTYKPSLISHQRVHTGEKPFSCAECGKLFSSKFNLKMHEKIHTGDKPVVCPACGKCFSNNPALVKHLRIHTGEKPFSCPECGKFFSSKSGLNAHLIIHTGEKPYMCSECGKSFANHSNLISHRIIHTGEKPYVCPECGKGFANQSNLAKHKVIHTEEKPFLCMECGKFFTRKGSLDKHRMRIHEKMKLV